MAAIPAPSRESALRRPAFTPAAEQATELFELHGDRVLAYCRRRLRSPEDAEDALQTTFLYACRGLRRGVEPESEIAWLLKIAHNVCLSHWDARRRRRLVELPREPESLERAAGARGADRDELQALEAALTGLTDLQRQAILLREWRGLSYREVAAELGVSLAAVETLIFRARRALAEGLELQDVRRDRSRLARALDLGGLLAAVKSALGGGAGIKAAATATVVCVAALSPGSAPRSAPERPAVQPATPAPVAVEPDPATSPAARAAARSEVLAAETARSEREKVGKAAREKPKPARAGRKEKDAGPAPAGQAVEGLLDGAVSTTGAAVGLVGGVAASAVGTVTETVGSSPVAQAPVVGDVLPAVEGTVAPVLETGRGLLGEK